MTTPQEIIIQALKKSGILGVGQSALAEDMNDAFLDLNDMLVQWRSKRWLVYRLETLSKVSTGALSYTIGPSGDINTQRPDRIESAFVRLINTPAPNQVDYPLQPIDAREDYNRIALKQFKSFPDYFFYDSDYPLGRIYVYPVPLATIYEIFISIKQPIDKFTSLTQDIDLPPEYMAALKFNLALRLLASYPGVPQNPALVGLAEDALNVIRQSNTQVAQLQMPPNLISKARYNIYSDETY